MYASGLCVWKYTLSLSVSVSVCRWEKAKETSLVLKRCAWFSPPPLGQISAAGGWLPRRGTLGLFQAFVTSTWQLPPFRRNHLWQPRERTSPRQSKSPFCSTASNDSWEILNWIYLVRNRSKGGEGGKLLLEELCPYLNKQQLSKAAQSELIILNWSHQWWMNLCGWRWMS